MKNDIEDYIIKQKREGKISHAYLIETNSYERISEKIKRVLKILLCNDSEMFCDKCQTCKFIDIYEHPNIVFISPDGANIKIAQIDDMKGKFKTKSSYAKYNIYVINEAEKLNITSGNALLKYLEEPEDNIIGILITNNRSLVLPTIVSRCQSFNILYESEDYKEDIIDLAQKIENCWVDENNVVQYSKLIKEINDKNQFKIAFSYILDQEVKLGTNKKKIIILKEIVEKMRYNVNIDLLLLNYIIRMREKNE